MNPGRMRHRIDIQQRVSSQDATTGEETWSWENLKSSLPAEALTGPGRESLQAGALQADTTARFTIRWFSGLTQSMRIVWDGRIYNIKTFTTDRTNRRYYYIDAGDEGVNSG